VTVDGNVRLEVLDWGGTGRPLLFIGCYLTGHVNDVIAPKLTDQFHVFALTRRGIAASDHPQHGYGPQRRAQDALDVIRALRMEAIVEDNQVKPDYARIGVPVLAIYGVKTVDQILKEFEPRTAEERSALFQRYVAGRAMLERWEGDLRAGVPGARIVELPGAGLYMFLSNEADIIREVGAFGRTLER